MEEHAQTMSTRTHAPVGRASLVFTVKLTSLIVQKVLASMVEPAQIKSMATPAPAALASLAPTANMKSMSVTPSPASMEESVRMPWSPSVAPVPRATLETDARHQWIGVGEHHLAKTADVVARKMLPSSVNVLTAGLDATVTFLESPVRLLLAREVCRLMNFAIMAVIVSIRGTLTIVNVLRTTPEAIAKIKWTTVRTNPVAMVPLAGDTWEDTSATVCLAILDRIVR